jgi:4-hydroxy-tetrahydrodipicolinate synthase
MSDTLFRGLGTALVTPFDPAGELDLEGLHRLVRLQEGGGVDFLVPCGSTGEAQTLSEAEREAVVRTTLEAGGGRLPVLAGISGNHTSQVVRQARIVSGWGVQGIMVVTPHYTRPSQAGLEAHFRAVADAATVPVLLYTVPGRTAVHLSVGTTLALAEHPNIVGVKDATGEVGWALQLLRERPDDFLVLSGEDGLALPHLASGADGLISVASNVVPELVAGLVHAALAPGGLPRARELQLRLLPLIDALFSEPNPVPAKAALELEGVCGALPRLPLVPASALTLERLRQVLDELRA